MVNILLLLSCGLLVQGMMPLRKHHNRIQSPVNESDLLPSTTYVSQVIAHYSTDNICGEASLSCMAFTPSTVPIRCGVLQKAHLCKRLDPVTQTTHCDAFCDTDGGGRLCQEAFPACCRNSMHGCISSKPRQIVYK